GGRRAGGGGGGRAAALDAWRGRVVHRAVRVRKVGATTTLSRIVARRLIAVNVGRQRQCNDARLSGAARDGGARRHRG
ncbi:hypothetical protein, partial [Burkholderia thailandensis]